MTVYVASRNYIEEELSICAQAIAAAVVLFVHEDREGYEAFVEKMDQYKTSRGFGPTDVADEHMPPELYEDDPYYQKMQSLFAKIKENSHIK